MDALPGMLILLAIVLLYFAPAIVGRNKANASAIFWLNFLAGWTFVGWIVALVWALTVEKDQARDPLSAAAELARSPLLCRACGKYSSFDSRFCRGCGQALFG
jgi:hypothetical protein